MANYLDNLNEAQLQAVQNFKGPSLIIAGAGSGKTRVLTYRIAHLLQNGVPPSSILALTFTNKAASGANSDITSLSGLTTALSVGQGGTGLTAGTSGGIPYYSSSSAMTSSGTLTANGVVLGGGAGAAPTTTAAGTANQVLRIPARSTRPL